MACYEYKGVKYTEEDLVKLLQSQQLKTRRILELQSDLFQKGRDKKDLANIKLTTKESQAEEFKTSNFKYNNENYSIVEKDEGGVFYDGDGLLVPYYYKGKKEIKREEYIKALVDLHQLKDIKINYNENQFLQLLNKNNNWVTFFVKSIIQDSAKKGYEKILFPSGDTASKVEGHTTLEEFKKQKEDRIKELEKQKENGTKTVERYLTDEAGQAYSSVDVKIDEEIAQLKQELERVEGPEGFAALKPIYNFYENTVANILNKTYGKENVKEFTDEYGNTWNELEIQEDRDLEDISFSKRSVPKAQQLLNIKPKEERKDPKNSYLELKKYRDNLFNKANSTLHALDIEIKRTTDLTRKQELLKSYESLRDYAYGNSSKGIVGLDSQQIELKLSLEEYNNLIKVRDEVERDLHFHKIANDAASIALEESRLAEINRQIHENKYEDSTSILRTFVHIDLNRAKELVKTGKLEDLKDALGIINYYKALEPTNTQQVNPFFTAEELKSNLLSPQTIEHLKEFAYFARSIEDEVYNGAKEVILDYINSLDYYTRLNDGKAYSSEDIFHTIDGLPDISALDGIMGNVSDNPYSKEQSILLNAMYKQLEDKIAGEQAAVKEIEDNLDEIQDATHEELVKLGHTVENTDGFLRSNNITNKLATFLDKNKASFTFFKQISKNGVVKNRLVQQASSNYESYIKEAKRIFRDQVESIREGKSKFSYDVVLHKYHNKLRESSHVIKPHLIAEIALDDRFSDLISESITYSANMESDMEAYRSKMIEEIGEESYKDLVEDQIRLLEEYVLTVENNKRKTLADYRDLLGDQTLEFEDIEDITLLDQLENWELDNNPFVLGFLFEENKKFKITRPEDSRTNHFSNYGSRSENIVYNTIIPRKNKVKILDHSPESIPSAFKKISIESSNELSGYLDPKYREIRDNEVLYKYWKTIMDSSDYYETSLNPTERANWEKGTIPLDKNVSIKRFSENADKPLDTILHYLVNPFRQLLQKFGDSISSVQQLAVDYSDIDMTTNRALKKINASGLNTANKAIHDEIMVIRATELYLALKEVKFVVKEKSLTRDKSLPIAVIPPKMLREALLLTGNYSEKLLRGMEDVSLRKIFKTTFEVPESKKGNKDISSINILGLLEDLHIQNNLLQSEEDLGLTMRKNMAEAAVINARRKGQVFIEFMSDFYSNIEKRDTTNSGKNISLFKNKGSVKLSGKRTHALKQLKSFMDNVVYLGGDSLNKSRTLAEDEADEEIVKSNNFNRWFLNKKDKLDLLDDILNNPELTEKQRTAIKSIKFSETKYVDFTKAFWKPLQTGARFYFLAAKVFTHVNNLVQGQKAIIQMDGTGTYWKPGDIMKAQQVMQQAFVRVISNGKVIPTPAGDKARFIIDRMQIIEDASSLEAKALHRNQTANYMKGLVAPFSRVKNVEYVNQGSVVLATLMSEKITDNTGAESNVWEALTKEGKLKNEFRYDSRGNERKDLIDTWEKFNSQAYFDYRMKLKEAINKTAGNYAFETSSLANNNEVGKLVLGLKRWMYELFSVYYGNERVSFTTGKVIKGRTRSFTPEEMFLQRAMSGVFNTGPISGILSAAPLYIFDLYMQKNSRIFNSETGNYEKQGPQLSWKDSSARLSFLGKIAMKTAVGLPLNLATNLVGVKPLVDLGTDTVFGKMSLKEKLEELGLSETDIGNVNAMGRALGMHLLITSVMLGMYVMLQTSFADDDEEEEQEEIKRRTEAGEIVYTRKKMAIMAYNLAQSAYKDGLTYMGNPYDMYKSVSSVAMLEWYSKYELFTQLMDKRNYGLAKDKVESGEDVGQSKTKKSLLKFLPYPGRDIKSASRKPYQVPITLSLLTADGETTSKSTLNIMIKEKREEVKEKVEDLSEKDIQSIYENNNWKFKASTEEDPRDIDNVRKAYVDRLMKDIIVKPTKKNILYKDAKKDAKKVLDGDMSLSEYKSKYVKEEED